MGRILFAPTKFGKHSKQSSSYFGRSPSHQKFIKISRYFVFLSSANAELYSLHHTVISVRGDSSQSSPCSSFVLPYLTGFLYFAFLWVFLKFHSKMESITFREKENLLFSISECKSLRKPMPSIEWPSLFN